MSSTYLQYLNILQAVELHSHIVGSILRGTEDSMGCVCVCHVVARTIPEADAIDRQQNLASHECQGKL